MEAGDFKWRGSCLDQDVEVVWSNSTLVLCVTPTHAFFIRTLPSTRVVKVSPGEGFSARVLVRGPAPANPELRGN